MAVKHFIEGWSNLLFSSGQKKSYIDKVSDQRLEICRQCPYHSVKVTEHCSKCGCPLAAKTRSLSSECPVGKWGAVEVSRL